MPLEDPYSSSLLVSNATRRTGSYIDFMGSKVCQPGWASPSCLTRLSVANPWYTADCPNLQRSDGDTWNADIDVHHLGGQTGCPGYAGGQPVSPCAYLCFAHTDYGVAVIPRSLWRSAQAGEGSWAKSSGESGYSDDRSAEMWEGFQQYAAVPAIQGALLEVGAGPWTQTKGLLHKRPDLQPTSFTIFEPMAMWYQANVATCSYKTGQLEKFAQAPYNAYYGKTPPKQYHHFPVHVIGQGGETLLQHSQRYDALVVMNVIEHVQNAFSFLQGLHQVLKPGGVLIFHERFWPTPPAADPILGRGGLHPIRINRGVLDKFLQHFDVILKNESPTHGMIARRGGEQGYFFIGRKK